MGSVAFSYYFPVIDRYIRCVTGSEEGDDCEVAILGSAVAAQIDRNDTVISNALTDAIKNLSHYVLHHLEQFSPARKDQRRIERAWTLVQKKLAERKSTN